MNVQRTILCIEDEDDLRNDIAEELAAADYNVLQASDGKEALAMLAAHRPIWSCATSRCRGLAVMTS